MITEIFSASCYYRAVQQGFSAHSDGKLGTGESLTHQQRRTEVYVQSRANDTAKLAAPEQYYTNNW